MRGAELRTVVPVVVLLLASACSTGGEATSTTAAVEPTTTVAPTTSTTPAPTTTTMPEATTSTRLMEGEVGSREALRAAIELAIRETEDFYDYDPSEVPIPDLTNPDPTVALREMLLFEAWVFANAPKSDWAAVYLHPEGTALSQALSALDTNAFTNWRFDTDPPLTVIRIDTFEATEAPNLETLPSGSVALSYEYGLSAYAVVDTESGEVIRRSPGVAVAERVSILTPTDQGWLEYLNEKR